MVFINLRRTTFHVRNDENWHQKQAAKWCTAVIVKKQRSVPPHNDGNMSENPDNILWT